ncbi:peptidyl-prolyl cis-trans isomerase E-like [Triticum aestivum]|uniref:peptidyl-prolyl cis-trans isomerase E-like n=1 Tax=Triticum aestivum TaxID=4565 RepID=UPI001D0204FB|nr:peptidyl-prolyl cis-trans isomerase E-like [Triticum aestivum]
MNQPVQKNTLYVGGLAEEVDEKILHAAFVPFGEVKDVKTPLDQATQKRRSFGFVTFLEREDTAAAMDNMDGAELFGRVLTVNYAGGAPRRPPAGDTGANPSRPRTPPPPSPSSPAAAGGGPPGFRPLGQLRAVWGARSAGGVGDGVAS